MGLLLPAVHLATFSVVMKANGALSTEQGRLQVSPVDTRFRQQQRSLTVLAMW